MGAKVDLTKALYDRLTTYTTPGSALDDIKSIHIGTGENIRHDTDYPIIDIKLMGGEEKNVYNKAGKLDEMEFKISYIDNRVNYDESNGLYDDEYELGPLYTLETLLNCIEKDPTTDTLDLSFGSTQNNQPSVRYNILYDDKLVIDIYLMVETKQFNGANR